jgi:hypothetical protein
MNQQPDLPHRRLTQRVLTKEVEQDRRLLARVFRELDLRWKPPIRWVEGPRDNVLEGDDPELLELNVTCTVVY